MEYERLCKTIDCGYEKRDHYVYSLHDRRMIEKEVAALRRLGVKAEASVVCELPFEAAGVLCVKEQAQFHPLKFLYAVAKDLPISKNTKIVETDAAQGENRSRRDRLQKIGHRNAFSNAQQTRIVSAESIPAPFLRYRPQRRAERQRNKLWSKRYSPDMAQRQFGGVLLISDHMWCNQNH